MASENTQKSSVLWMLKTSKGEQLGPLTTESVLALITDGNLDGTEQIRKHPDGIWMPISKRQQFYDKLLEVLESAVNNTDIEKKHKITRERLAQTERLKKNQSMADFTKQQVKDSGAHSTDSSVPQSAVNSTASKKTETQSTGSEAFRINYGEALPGQKIIDLNDMEQVENLAIKAKRKVPLLFVGLAAIIFLISLFYQGPKSLTGKPNLILPKVTLDQTMAQQDIKKGFQAAVALFLLDEQQNLVESEKKLVTLIEGDPKNADLKGMLCLVYKELWPYVKQDPKDIDSFNTLVKYTKAIDPIGINGLYCEISRLIVFGKANEAKGMLDLALNRPDFASAPVLYYFKSEIFSYERNFKNAYLYSDKALQLWPSWAHVSLMSALFRTQEYEFSSAVKYFENTLIINPQHKRAMIELAVVKYKPLRLLEDAKKQLKIALAMPGSILRSTEAKAYYVLAQISLDQRDQTTASKYVKIAFDLHPSDSKIRDLLIKLGGSAKLSKDANQENELIYLGDQFARIGDHLSAQAEYKSAFDVDPKNSVAAFKAAKSLWQLNLTQESFQWLQRAIAIDPKFASAYATIADYYSQKYNYAQAIQYLSKGVSQLNNNYELLRSYGLVEYRRNNMKDAVGFLQRALKIYDNDIETLNLLSKSFLMLHDFNMAKQYSVNSLELDSTNNESQIIYAQVLAQFQGVDSGILYLKDLISRFSYTIDFRLALAEMYKSEDRFNEANDIFTRITEADPRNKKAFIGQGESLQGMAQFEKALRSFLNAAILDPSDAEPLYKAGLLYYEKEQYNEAITQLKRAQKINEFYPRINYKIGQSYFMMGQLELALQYSMEERKNNPNIADSYLLAAEVYSSTKQFVKCANEYQQAIKLRPQGSELYIKIARCYRQSGNPDVAESMLNIAASQESGNPDIYKEQGALYEIRSDHRSAVQAYNKYLSLSPNAPDKVEIENRILSLSK